MTRSTRTTKTRDLQSSGSCPQYLPRSQRLPVGLAQRPASDGLKALRHPQPSNLRWTMRCPGSRTRTRQLPHMTSTANTPRTSRSPSSTVRSAPVAEYQEWPFQGFLKRATIDNETTYNLEFMLPRIRSASISQSLPKRSELVLRRCPQRLRPLTMLSQIPRCVQQRCGVRSRASHGHQKRMRRYSR